MAIDLFLAMTGAEIGKNKPLPSKIAWMACHFSPYGTGLSNLPESLPPGSLIIVNDRTPVCGHDPGLIAEQLTALWEELHPQGILLDFQRPNEPETAAIAGAIVSNLPCPVGVTEAYGKDLDCALFLPPVPLLMTVDEYLSPWPGREIWLEIAPQTQIITVTPEGSSFSFLYEKSEAPFPHQDNRLYCHYRIEADENKALFTLHREQMDIHKLLDDALRHRITAAIGLYQELGQT